MSMKHVVGIHHVTLTVALLLCACASAQAELILYEPFDYGSTNASLAGMGGNELGFTSSEKWSNDVGTATYYPTSLVFGALQTTGGHAYGSHTVSPGNNLSRGIHTNATGTIYGSFLWQPNVVPSGVSEGINIGGQYSSFGACQFGVLGSRDTSTPAGRSSVYVRGAIGDNPTGSIPVQGTNYLALFKVTNVGGPNGSTNTLWLLTAGQFSNFKADGLTEGELNAAAIGSASTNVYQRATVSTNLYPTMVSTNYLTLRNYLPSGSAVAGRYDEIRFAAGASASLDEVTPITSDISEGTQIFF